MTQRNDNAEALMQIRMQMDNICSIYQNRHNMMFRDTSKNEIAFFTVRASWHDLDENGEINWENPINRYMHIAFTTEGRIYATVNDEMVGAKDYFYIGYRYYAFDDILENAAIQYLANGGNDVYGFYLWKTFSDVRVRERGEATLHERKTDFTDFRKHVEKALNG